MTKLLASLLFFSFKNDLIIKDFDIGCLNVSEKNDGFKGSFSYEKQIYRRSRDPKNKHSQKLKDCFKELEELIENHNYIFLRWGIEEPLLLLFSNGIIVSIKLNEENSSIEKIVIDNYLCGKLVSEHLVDALLDERRLIISYIEPKITYVYFNQEFPSFLPKNFNSKKGKILGTEPKISNVDIISPYGKRFERKLSLNHKKDCVLIWWCKIFDEVGPWTPINYSLDHINMLLYTVNGPEIEALCSVKVNGELLNAKFSSSCTNHILSLEEIKRKHTYTVNICTYELARGRCQCISLTEIPTQAHIASLAWNSSEDKVLLAGDDKALLIYDITSNSTLVTSTVFHARYVSWHPGSSVVFVLGSRGELQCLDSAFNHIKLEVLSEVSDPLDVLDLKSFFSATYDAQQIFWRKYPQTVKVTSSVSDLGSDSFLVSFNKGPVVFIKLSVCINKCALTGINLISQYLKCGNIKEAIFLLQQFNWIQQAELCFNSLNMVVNYLLRRALNSKTETALEQALGFFYNSCTSLPPSVLNDYKFPVNHLARRFFHHLLRYHRFDKAFLLAIDLKSRDLFLDLHHMARRKGENMLAIVAFQRAEELLSESSSYCDESEESEDGSISSRSISASETDEKGYFDSSVTFNDQGDLSKEYSSYKSYFDQKLLSHDYAICDNRDFTSHMKYSQHPPKTLCIQPLNNIAQPSVDFINSSYDFNASTSRFSLLVNQSFKKKSVHRNLNREVLEGERKQINSPNLCAVKVKSQSADSEHDGTNANCLENIGEHKKVISCENLSVQNEYFEEEDEDVEGTRIKLVHFGIV